MTTRAFDLDALLDSASILVCCGAGGVGKTTTSAALALRASERGRRVCVLTIDPARRLAQSMGLSQLDNEPREVKGIDGEYGGRLFAMMLDMKRTFDEVVERHADPQRAQLSGASRATMISSQPRQRQAGMRWPHHNCRDTHQSRMLYIQSK